MMKSTTVTTPWLTKALPILAAVVACAVGVYVVSTRLPAGAVALRVPLAGPDDGAATTGESPLAQGKTEAGSGLAADLPGEWPGFRGPNRDGVAVDPTPLADAWPESGPPVLWGIDAGEGYAGAAVLGGKVYLMDYDRERQADTLRCLSLADGREIWRFSYPLAVKRNHGMSRTVPAVTPTRVVAMGPLCHVCCLDANDGAVKWTVDLGRKYGTKVPAWYAGQCPLIDGDLVILAPAGSLPEGGTLLVALDLETGEERWRTPNPRDWRMTHVSVAPMAVAGVPTYVYCGHRGVAAVSARDGALLWENMDWKISIATVATPVPVGDGRLFLSGGYEAGAMMLAVAGGDAGWRATQEFRLPQEVFGATQQTPVFYQDHLYGIRPSGELVCLDLSGKMLWTSGMNHRFGLGPLMIADGKILALDDDGNLTMARATPARFEPLAQARVLQGHEAWGPMALAGSRLLVRDLTRMVCLDLGKK
jgi:outer membrane protein assembly factor BamB